MNRKKNQNRSFQIKYVKESESDELIEILNIDLK